MNTPHKGNATDFDWVVAQAGWEAFQRLRGENPRGAPRLERLPKTASPFDAVVPTEDGWVVSAERCERCGRRGADHSDSLGQTLCGRCWQRAFWASRTKGADQLPEAAEVERVAREAGLEVLGPDDSPPGEITWDYRGGARGDPCWKPHSTTPGRGSRCSRSGTTRRR